VTQWLAPLEGGETLLYWAMAQAQLEHVEEAREAAERIRAEFPSFTVEGYIRDFPVTALAAFAAIRDGQPKRACCRHQRSRFGWRKRAKFPVKPRSVGPGRVECPSRHEISLTARFAEQRKRDRLSDCHRPAENGSRDRLATGRLRHISSSFRVSVVFRPFPPT
jgi:hypothetical protein